MLNFSKTKIVSIYFIFILISIFAFFNVIKSEKNYFNKKVKLGLDLQGGSYLLLENETDPLIQERIQDKVIVFKKFLNENNYKYKNFIISKNSITFTLTDGNKTKLEKDFFKKFNNLVEKHKFLDFIARL